MHERTNGNQDGFYTKGTRDHIHVIIRTPNGNDHGKDLLRQHLELTYTKDAKGTKFREPSCPAINA
ncbi:MAG TPA: hypothetical protein VMM36_01390 [Opitutaceae bacterium]|nr:hypothetical protein [Opitutaceae bacterium]